VVGFSQGGGVAFDAGSCSTPDVKAVVSLAGILANGDCTKEAAGKPADVLIVYNDGDPTVKPERIAAFQEQLTKDGYASKLETFAGTTHWPAPEGLIRAQNFIVEQLGGK
jgi:dienelactone hydrolase